MMRTHLRLIPYGFAFVVATAVSSFADEPAKTVKPSEAEKEVQAADDAFIKAYNAGDAKAIAATFTEDAEAIDDLGESVRGRAAILKVYESLFEQRKGWKLQIKVDSLRIVAPDTAIETGRSVLTSASAAPEASRYTAVLLKRDGKWLQTYVRETSEKLLPPKDRLKDLDWLLGEWVDESSEAVVFTSCQRSKDGHFLIREFTTHVGGKPEMASHQRIGWDPLTEQFKSWVFDSEGGHGEGLWSRAGDQWVVKSSGVLGDGKLATSTQLYTIDGKNRIHFRSIDRTVGGEALDDGIEVILVKKPPAPPQANTR